MTTTLPWNDIETVLLDMDGTLLDLHFDNYFWEYFLPRQYAKQYHLSVEAALNKIKGMYKEKHGQLEWYSIDYWQEELGMDIMALKEQEAHRLDFRPNVKTFLDFLLNKNITPVLITNAHPKSLDLKMQRCSLHPWIKEQFSTHNFNLAKEHPDFWNHFSNEYAFDKTKCVFIDDNEAVLNNAERFGIAHLFSIAYPDSTQTEVNVSRFPLIRDFLDIIAS